MLIRIVEIRLNLFDSLQNRLSTLRVVTSLLFTRVLGTAHEPRSADAHHASDHGKQRHSFAAYRYTQGERHCGY